MSHNNILHLDPNTYYVSTKFNVSNLISGMKASLDTLAHYKEHPIYKADVNYHIQQLLEGTLILEKYIKQTHDYYLTEDDDKVLEREYISRNIPFLEEHSDNSLREFYSNIKAHEDQVYQQAKERIAL